MYKSSCRCVINSLTNKNKLWTKNKLFVLYRRDPAGKERNSPRNWKLEGDELVRAWKADHKSRISDNDIELMIILNLYRAFSIYIYSNALYSKWYMDKEQTTTPGTTCPTLYDECVGSLTSHFVGFKFVWLGLWSATRQQVPASISALANDDRLAQLVAITVKMQETGPTVYRPYPRRLKYLTICRCHYKGSIFSSVILRPWVLVRSGARTRDLTHGSPTLYSDITQLSILT